MNCSGFWEILVEHHEGRLTPAARLSARVHLSECAECARLAEIVSGKLDLLESEEGQFLHRSILLRTSGTACKRARRELKRQRCGELDRGTAELLLLHLKACASCRTAAEAASEGKRQRLRRLFLAPGFDWAAAYAGALVVFALLAVMPAVWDSASSLTAGPTARAGLIMPAVEQESRGILCGLSSAGAKAATAVQMQGRKVEETANSLLSGTQLWVASRAESLLAGQQKAWSKIHLVLCDILG